MPRTWKIMNKERLGPLPKRKTNTCVRVRVRVYWGAYVVGVPMLLRLGCLAGARRSVGGPLLCRLVDLLRSEENDRLAIDRSGRGDRQVQ